MLEFIELGLDIKYKINIISAAHIRNKQLCTAEDKPNNLYCMFKCSMNSTRKTSIRENINRPTTVVIRCHIENIK